MSTENSYYQKVRDGTITENEKVVMELFKKQVSKDSKIISDKIFYDRKTICAKTGLPWSTAFDALDKLVLNTVLIKSKRSRFARGCDRKRVIYSVHPFYLTYLKEYCITTALLSFFGISETEN